MDVYIARHGTLGALYVMTWFEFATNDKHCRVQCTIDKETPEEVAEAIAVRTQKLIAKACHDLGVETLEPSNLIILTAAVSRVLLDNYMPRTSYYRKGALEEEFYCEGADDGGENIVYTHRRTSLVFKLKTEMVGRSTAEQIYFALHHLLEKQLGLK